MNSNIIVINVIYIVWVIFRQLNFVILSNNQINKQTGICSVIDDNLQDSLSDSPNIR